MINECSVTHSFVKPLILTSMIKNNVFVTLCEKTLTKRIINPYFNISEFDLMVKAYIISDLEDLYQIDEKDNQKDILSKILFLPDDFLKIKFSMIRNIIDNAIIVSKNNNRLFLETSTLLRDIVIFYHKLKYGPEFKTTDRLLQFLIQLVRKIIDEGLDLNYIHKWSDDDQYEGTSLMILIKSQQIGKIWHVNDLVYSTIAYITSDHIHRINIDVQNINGETALTYLAKFSAFHDRIFKTFRDMLEKSVDPFVIYKSDVHYVAIKTAIDTNTSTHTNNTMDTHNHCRIIKLLYDKYPIYNKEIDTHLRTLSDNLIERFDSKDFDSYGPSNYRTNNKHASITLEQNLLKHLRLTLDESYIKVQRDLLRMYREKYVQFKDSIYFK